MSDGNSTGYYHLPLEILRLIVEFSEPKERAALALTCRYFHEVTEIYMLKYIKQTGPFAIPLLIGKLLDASESATTTHLVLQECSRDWTSFSGHQISLDALDSLGPPHWKKINRLLQKYFRKIEGKALVNDFHGPEADEEQTIRESFREWYKSAQSDEYHDMNYEPLAAILILLLPHLRYFEYRARSTSNAFLYGILATAERLQRANKHHFAYATLQEIYFKFEDDFEGQATLQDLCPVLELPSLQRFTCEGFHFFTGDDDDNLCLQQVSSIKEFAFIHYQYHNDEWPVIYSQNFDNLERVFLTYRNSINKEDTALHLAKILDHLHTLKDTLTHLTICDDAFEGADPEDYWAIANEEKRRREAHLRSSDVGTPASEDSETDTISVSTVGSCGPVICSLGEFSKLRYLNLQSFAFNCEVREVIPEDASSGYDQRCHMWEISDFPPNLVTLVVASIEISPVSSSLVDLLAVPEVVNTRAPHLKRIEIVGLSDSSSGKEVVEALFGLISRYASVGIVLSIEMRPEEFEDRWHFDAERWARLVPKTGWDT